MKVTLNLDNPSLLAQIAALLGTIEGVSLSKTAERKIKALNKNLKQQQAKQYIDKAIQKVENGDLNETLMFGSVAEMREHYGL